VFEKVDMGFWMSVLDAKAPDTLVFQSVWHLIPVRYLSKVVGVTEKTGFFDHPLGLE
jgi:hypothetical protein